MKIVGKIVGLNLLILVMYFIGVSFIGGFESEITQLFFLGVILIPTHVITCLVLSSVSATSEKRTKEERKLFTRAHLLSGLVVLSVGFSFCSMLYLR